MSVEDGVDIETRFGTDGTALHRWCWEATGRKHHGYVGPWMASREDAYRAGQTFLAAGRL